MKPIRIKVTDTERVQKALDEGQLNAKARLVHPSDITALAACGERELERIGLAKAYRAGAQVVYLPAKVANSYGYPAAASYATVTRGKSGNWYLTDIHRSTTGSKSYGGSASHKLVLSADQQSHWISTHPLLTEVVGIRRDKLEELEARALELAKLQPPLQNTHTRVPENRGTPQEGQ